MASSELLESLYQIFDPESPVVRKEWRASRPNSPAKRIVKHLRAQIGEQRFLLLGTVGTGKSTELVRIAEERAQGDFVVLLDLVRHFGEVVCDMGALQRISPWEVVFLSGLAVMRATEIQFGERWDPELIRRLEAHWRAVADLTQPDTAPRPEINLSTLAKTMVFMVSDAVQPGLGTAAARGLTLIEKASGAVKWNVPLALPGANRVHDQNTEVRKLLDTVNEVFQVAGEYRRLLLVIDGLDRIQEFSHARDLLIDSELIQQLDAAMVVCGPFVLRHHMSTAAIRRFRVETLVNEPVLDKKTPAHYGPGVSFFCDLFHHRSSTLSEETVIVESLLKRLAYYSGGRARDFVRLVRECASTALIEDRSEMDQFVVALALDSQRRILEMGLDRGHIELLQEVMADPERRLPDDPRVMDLLSIWRLLPYPNESEWYYPHPMLTISLLSSRLPG